MATGEQPPPLDELGERLAAARDALARRTGEGSSGPGSDARGYGFAVRLAIELVSTLAVGVLLGWALDRWLGTAPLFLVVMFFLGAAAGAFNVYRVTKSWGGGGDDDTTT
ncbi:MAG: AtpZ/AtpI family protein [Alphaproteobacteria bacterium]